MIGTKTETGAKGKSLSLGLLVAAFMVACLLLTARPAHAATFTVNSTGDGADADTTDNICASDAGTASEQCTLRAAIQQANATSGADEIHFSIPGSVVHTITPNSALPPITERVTIDGYTQGDGSPGDPSDDATENTLEQGNNAVLKIELDGTNAFNGLRIQAANSTIKGLIINRFGNPSVWIQGSGDTRNKVEGNFIGTDATGTVTDPDGIPDNGDELGNLYGVDVEGSNNTVGGTTAAARNIISGNIIGVAIFGTPSTPGNRVMGNYIGTDKHGDDGLGNNLGVLINGGSNNTIGGTEAGARNVISGNTPSQIFGQDGNGVHFTSFGTTDNKVEGNYIGISAAGDAKLANAGDGVFINGEANNNTIGGTTAGAGNIISGNGGDGVEVSYYHDSNNPGDNDPTPPVGNRILSNSIYDNDALGIDLATPPNEPPGVTNNDTRDLDTGANGLQNFPVITSATTTKVQGILNSTPNQTFTIQLFSSDQADGSGFGEGKQLLAQQTVTTSADSFVRKKKKKKKKRRTIFIPGGNAAFEFVLPAGTVTAGDVVTATATNTATGDTSEFSGALTVSS